MRIRTWVWMTLAAAVLGVLVWDQLTRDGWVTAWMFWAVVGVFVVLVGWRVVRAVARPGDSARRAIAPGVQGLDEVQGLSLGRPPAEPVTYGNEPRPVAELVLDRPDPLDDEVWLV